MWGLGICVAAQVNKIMIHIPRSFPVTLKRNQAQAFALYSRYLISIQLWFKVFYNAVRRLHFIQLPRSTWEREAWWWSKSCTCSYRWSWSDLAFVTNIVCASKDGKPSLCLLFILSSIPFPLQSEAREGEEGKEQAAGTDQDRGIRWSRGHGERETDLPAANVWGGELVPVKIPYSRLRWHIWAGLHLLYQGGLLMWITYSIHGGHWWSLLFVSLQSNSFDGKIYFIRLKHEHSYWVSKLNFRIGGVL